MFRFGGNNSAATAQRLADVANGASGIAELARVRRRRSMTHDCVHRALFRASQSPAEVVVRQQHFPELLRLVVRSRLDKDPEVRPRGRWGASAAFA